MTYSLFIHHRRLLHSLKRFTIHHYHHTHPELGQSRNHNHLFVLLLHQQAY